MSEGRLSSWPDGWRSWRRHSWADRRLLFEAALWLGLARLAVRAVPFRRLAPFLGKHEVESAVGDVPERSADLRRVAWAVRAASLRLPWRCLCLEQAIAAKMMLRRLGLENTLYLGAARTDDGMEAHAWLRSGSFILTGAEGRERFAVVATFADDAG